MSDKKQIVVTAPADPSKPVRVETNGFVGEGCKAITEGLEAALGSVVHEDLKDEFHQRSHDQEEHQTQ